MKETYWGYWLIILGILIIGVMLLVNSTSTNSTQDYYTLKEVTQASMIDAVDFAYYRLYGNIKMSEQKFVENFLRRFADNTNLSNTYNVDFYDLYEVPPKVSVKISTKTGSYNVANDPTAFDITNTIDAILEFGVPNDADTGEITKMLCPLYINPTFGAALKDGRVTNGKAAQILSKWKELDPETTSDVALKKAFLSVYSNLETTRGDVLYSTYPEMRHWVKDGYITYHSI